MELEINKNSFLKEFTDVHNMGNRTIKKRSVGFMYLHNMITKKLAEGSKFTIGNLDFSQFTYDDMNDYIGEFQAPPTEHEKNGIADVVSTMPIISGIKNP